MKQSIATLLLGIGSVMAVSAVAQADTDIQKASAEDWRFSVEVDPLDYVLSGYSLVANVSPGSLPQWRFGAAIFALDLPSAMVEADSANEGFGMRIDMGLGLSGSYFFSKDRRGWYAGPSAGVFFQEFTHDASPGVVTEVTAIGVAAQAGYQWFPVTDLGLYIEPWMNFGLSVYESAKPIVGSNEFSPLPVIANVALHIGYEF